MEIQEFGARLRDLRNQAGLTQRELAERVSVDFTYLSKIESGAASPPSKNIISRLAEVLNADKDELMTLAGKIPADIVEILKNQEILQRLRSAHAKEMARSLKKTGATAGIMKQLMGYKSLPRVAMATVLVLAVAGSLWFSSPTPVRAVEATLTDVPATMYSGTVYTFYAEVVINTNEAIPINSLRLDLTGPTTAYVVFNVCGTITDQSPDIFGITSVDVPYYDYGYRYGFGYGYQPGTGYGYFSHWWEWGYGYGYGYGGYAASTQLRCQVTLDTAGLDLGSYEARLSVNTGPGEKKFVSPQYSFSLSAAPAPVVRVRRPSPAPPPPPSEVTDVSTLVTDEGVFTQDVIAPSADGTVQLAIAEGTVGLIEGEPLSEISITEIDPPPQRHNLNVIGLVYDFEPDGATFRPPITLTFEYDPDLIPAGVAEEDLVIAMWDEAAGEAGEWVNLVCTVDPVTNTITASVSHFTPFAVIAYTWPAVFTASDLTISPTLVDIGETVTISAVISNTGDATGSYAITLSIDKVRVATKEITVVGGASEKVTFTTSRDVAGTYAVNVNGLSGKFTVKALPAPPPPPAPPPVVVPPPAAPPPVVPPVVNWWLIAGIGVAVAVILGLLVYFLAWRRV